MNQNATVLSKAAELARDGRAFMLLNVIANKGSAPRSAGAKMIVIPAADKPEQIGTVGGGKMEFDAIHDAVQLFAEQRSEVRRYDLSPKAGQACGGLAEIFLEYIGSPLRLIIFGAGHVALELVHTVRDGGFAISVVDEREEWNSPQRFPGAKHLRTIDEGVAAAQHDPAATLVCVMTHNHEHDLQICSKLLSEPPAYLGVIGSKTKQKAQYRKLIDAGFDQSLVDSIHCPIGIGDLGKVPSLVAVSIAAQVLGEAKTIADAC